MSSQTTSEATASATPGHDDDSLLITDKRLRLFVYLVLMCSVFMAMMDVQIVSTALPTIVGEFGSIEGFSWVTSAYLLTSSAVMPLYGKLGDLFGRKYVLIAVIVLFAAGSIACAAAVSMETLIAARVLQALGGGGIMVSVFSVNADIFTPRERAKYQSYTSLVLMLAGAIGPTLGGFLTDHFGWRSIFLINVPIGIAVVISLSLLLPYKRPLRAPKIDYLGAALLAGAISSLVLWADSPTLFGSLIATESVAIVAAGCVCAISWVLVERRAAEPVIPLELFQNQTITLLLIISAAGGCMGIGMANYYALFLQSGLGLSPSMAGLFFIPLTGGIAFGSVNAGRLIFKTGLYKPFAIASAATAASLLVLLTFIDKDSSLVLLVILLFLQGMGTGIGQQVPLLGVQNAAPKRDVGAATGLTTLSRMGGASIAISVYGTLVSYVINSSSLTLPGAGKLENLTPEAIARLPAETQAAVHAAYIQALHPVFFTAALLGFLGLLAALCLKNRRLEHTPH
ncbi:MDR family MFS transporter [Roseibium litorale]|uniref:MFS transporter n=1 Tax=Roseibium litorale TaxID=2803841 RepID=A0ABR9CQZ6_9HYPH|nr:MDR family MFS transporter [Roseibium litorale]MBD8893254.1 MFS transporter [Roseibium litorale]